MADFNHMNNGQATAARGAGLFITIGFISALASLVIYPFIFGVLGVVMGILATKKESRTGLAVIISSIVLMGVGLIFSPVIRRYLGF